MGPTSAARRSRERRSLGIGVILSTALLCCLTVSAARGQAATGDAAAASYWTEAERQTYNQAKASLDAGQMLTSRTRRDLEDVCDKLAQALRNSTNPFERSQLRDLLVGVSSYAADAVAEHLLVPDASEIIRLQGMMVLFSIDDPVKPKAGILAALDDPSPAIQLWALRGAAKNGYSEAAPKVKRLLLSPSQEVSVAAIDACSQLAVSDAQGYLVALADREANRRKNLEGEVTQLQSELQTYQTGSTQTADTQRAIDSVQTRIRETEDQAALVNVIIFKVGEALGSDGLELTGFLSEQDLDKVVARLKAKFPPPATM